MKAKLHFTLALTLILLLAACTGNNAGVENATQSPSETPVSPTNTPAPLPTEVPQIAILLVANGSTSELLAEAEAALNQAAPAAGLQILRQETLDPVTAPAGLRLVVTVGPENDPAALAAALPQAQFVALGYSGLTPSTNLTVISNSAGGLTQAFIAGYIAAVQSDQWRIGVISTNDAAGQNYRRAFVNGVLYFCGNCAPLFPPYETYPIYVELPPNASPTELEAAAEVLFSRGVQIVHVYPTLQTEAIYQYLVQRGMVLIGTAAPPAGLEGSWVASVVLQPEVSLAETLTAVLNSGPVGQIGATIKIDFTGLSAARINHFEEIIQMLETGQIDPIGEAN